MSSEDLAYLTAVELSERYARRALSPLAVTQRVLERIERLQPSLNAFVWLDADSALRDARASEQRWERGQARGPLDGVPVSIKDLLQARGWPTLRGSRTTDAAGPWEVDAPAVARLREAGAVLLGKTATSEFGLKGLGDSPVHGVTRSPWNREHTTGGSSAGAVAAVAAGLTTIAIGTDGGGSIRVPSAYTGVVGLKPSFGRVPNDPPTFVGVPAHVGPIARSVSDVRRALAVIALPDARDPFHVPAQHAAPEPRALSDFRIGYSARFGLAEVDREVAAAFERAIATLRAAGARLTAADPGFAPAGDVLRVLFAARAAHSVRQLSPAQRALLDPAIAASAREGDSLSAVDYLSAEATRVELAQHMARYHERFDLLLTPTTAYPAPRLDLPPGSAGARTPFAFPFSLTRQPALSIPIGSSAAGLPIGLQIVGRLFHDADVLDVAQALEQLLPPLPRPPL